MEKTYKIAPNVIKNLIAIVIPLFFALLYQYLWILMEGSSFSKAGCFIFLLEIALYLFNLLWVLPELYEKKQFGQFTLKTIAVVLLFMLAKIRMISSAIWTKRFWELVFSSEQWRYLSVQIFLIMGMSYFVGFYQQNKKNQLQKEAALKAKLDTMNELRRIETTSYQLQLNPHLTFNVLNRIRLQTQEQLPHVSEAALLLATILRRSLVDPINAGKVDVALEINMVEDFITIQQFLTNNTLFINYLSEIDTASQLLEMPPGILITLADNLFKYGVTNEADYAAQFSIAVTEGCLRLRSWNYKSLHVLSGTGVGLKNVSSILEYYYQDKFKLEIDDKDDTFELTLEIEL